MPAYVPEEFTPEMIAGVIDSLEDSLDRLRAVRDWMKLAGIEKLPIKNSKEMKNKALPKLSLFAQAAIDAKRERELGN